MSHIQFHRPHTHPSYTRYGMAASITRHRRYISWRRGKHAPHGGSFFAKMLNTATGARGAGIGQGSGASGGGDCGVLECCGYSAQIVAIPQDARAAHQTIVYHTLRLYFDVVQQLLVASVTRASLSLPRCALHIIQPRARSLAQHCSQYAFELLGLFESTSSNVCCGIQERGCMVQQVGIATYEFNNKFGAKSIYSIPRYCRRVGPRPRSLRRHRRVGERWGCFNHERDAVTWSLRWLSRQRPSSSNHGVVDGGSLGHDMPAAHVEGVVVVRVVRRNLEIIALVALSDPESMKHASTALCRRI